MAAVTRPSQTPIMGGPRKDASHVTDRAIGGVTVRRVVRLRVIGGTVAIDGNVPKTTADCPPVVTADKPCPHVRCREHLWLVVGEDRMGNPQRNIPSMLRPVWAEWPLPPSCGRLVLKQAIAEGWTEAQIAAAIGVRTRYGVWRLLDRAREKLRTEDVDLREYLETEDS